MEFDLARGTIYLAITGSHAYGMATPESDIDVRGVAIAPIKYYTGFQHRFKQADVMPEGFWDNIKWDPKDASRLRENFYGVKDVQVMDLQKFCALAMDANPNILEQLFLPEECILNMRGEMYAILSRREAFLSKKVRHSFAGYAHSQIKRIRGHRVWLQNPPKEPPKREDFGLPPTSVIPKDQWQAAESMVEKRIQEWLVNPEEEIPVTVLTRVREAMTDSVASVSRDQDPESAILRAAAHQLGLDDNFIRVLDCERRYKIAGNHWRDYQFWIKSRNPKRAELEARHGYDTKHASHVVRLTRMCEELLTTGKLHVNRRGRDADELLSIRAGAWSYEKLEIFADNIDRKMDELYKSPTCPLPHSPDREKIDAVCSTLILQSNDLYGPYR